MLRDRFDQITLLALIVTLAALFGLLGTAGFGHDRSSQAGTSKQLEREIALQAKQAFLERRYGPVNTLRDAGETQAALLKLEELEREMPGEAHGALLRGEMQFRMGALEPAVASLAAAVKQNGDYVDMGSPLNQRSLIETIVDQGLPQLRDRLRTQPDSPSLAVAVKQVYYLQSRLAGGCE